MRRLVGFARLSTDLVTLPALSYHRCCIRPCTVKSGNGRPLVFVLGDSISADYTPALRRVLAAEADVERKPGNGKSSRHIVAWLRHALATRRRVAKRLKMLGSFKQGLVVVGWAEKQSAVLLPLPPKVDVLLLNCGLWDFMCMPGQSDCFVPLQEYEANVGEALQLASETVSPEGTLLWVASTHVDDAIHNAPSLQRRRCRRHNVDAVMYSAVAERLCAAQGVPVLDLHAFTAGLEHRGQQVFRDHVHFHTDVCEAQGAFLAGHLFPILRSHVHVAELPA